MEEVKKDVLTLLGPEVNVEQVETIIRLVAGQFGHILRRYDPMIDIIPEELNYIVTEVSVARFNRIGSEGMSAESVEGHSVTYQDYFKNYLMDIEKWAENQGYLDDRRGKVRVL